MERTRLIYLQLRDSNWSKPAEYPERLDQRDLEEHLLSRGKEKVEVLGTSKTSPEVQLQKLLHHQGSADDPAANPWAPEEV